jgi:peroxiredoxin
VANLTGEYDVAIELGLGLVNCVLATIHENQNEAYPRLPHSFSLYVNDAYRGSADPVPQVDRTGVRTRAEVQVSTPTVSLPLEGLADPIWSRTRAAVTTALRPGVGPTGSGSIGPVQPGGRRTCWPRITVSVRVRAWLRDRPEVLPEFLHGDLHLTAGVVRNDLLRGPRPLRRATFLGLDLGSGLEVRFEPAPGTTLTEEQRVLAERLLRNFLRSDAEAPTFKLDLPQEVHRFDYKLEPTGPLPSAMLIFTLEERPPGPHGPGSVTARFLSSGADFAVAVGRDYLLETLREELDTYLTGEYTGSGTGYSYRVIPDWDSASLDLQPGRIAFSVSGSGSITYGFPPFAATDDFSFTIGVGITLQVGAAGLQPALAGEPAVDLYDVAAFEGTIRDKARVSIKDAFNAAFHPPPPPAPQSQLQEALDVGRPLADILAALYPASPGVALTGAEIRPDGVVVAGTVGLAPSRPVEVRRVGLNGLADALESWIPGGTIERFVWGSRVEEHRFVTEKQVAMVEERCLSVQGTRVTRGGALVPVSAEDCPLVIATLPLVPGLPTPPVPCRRPLLPLLARTPDGRIEVVGHYDPWASGIAPSGGATNLLVHFAAGPWAEAAAMLEQALAATRKRDAALVVVGVLGTGSLAQVASHATLDADVTLHLAEDPTGNWASAFGVSETPATALIGPDGRVRWKGEAPVDPGKLSKVLDKQLETGGEVSWQALRLAVAMSDQAPDAPLRLGEGRQLALRRLRGAPAVLSFWTSCSEPSIEQLRQLREAVESGGADRPHVLGIGDGESPHHVSELAKREQLPFPLIPDPEREIARRYGISTWPTTVQIDPDGRVAAADLGLVPGLSPCDRPTMAGTFSLD